MEYLIFFTCLFALWIRLLLYPELSSFIPVLHLKLLPIYCLIGFGLVSVFIVLYRTFTFNNCPEAHAELKAEIIDARQDLGHKGYQF